MTVHAEPNVATYPHREEVAPVDVGTGVRRLVAAGVLGDHVVYEQPPHVFVAGRPALEVVVRRGRVLTRAPGPDGDAGPVGVQTWSDSPWPAVEAALAAAPDRAAYGRLDVVPDGTPDVELARLVVPSLEVTVRDGRAQVAGDDAALVATVSGLLREPDPLPPAPPDVGIDPGHGRERYLDAVRRAIAAIEAGLLAKVIVSRTVPVPDDVDLAATWSLGRTRTPAARTFLLDLGGRSATGFSPETVLEAAPDGRVSTQPLAGTRARGADPVSDARLRAELLADPKEVYEHATSVKLAIEELTGVSEPGSVVVGEFLAVAPRGAVQHLGSRVHGVLADGTGPWEALAALFPAVTASGIPKAPALALIDELEDSPRGLYSGAVVRRDPAGGLDAALVLRAVLRDRGRTVLRAGAGVVAASRPEREYTETCEKLAAVAPWVRAHRT